MRRFVLVALSAALLPPRASLADAPASLEDLPVAGTQTIAPEQYQEAAALAAGGGTPIEIALRIAGPFEGTLQQLREVNEGAESPSASRITVLRDGLLDDSLRGDRWDVSLARMPEGGWRIVDVKRAWRCRRGGQTDRFDSRPCP